MKLAAIAAAIAALLPSAARTESVFLTCRMIAEPDFPLSDVYRDVPPDDQQYFSDLTESGIGLFVIQPPTTWALDIEAKTVTSPNALQDYEVSDSSPSSIRAEAVIPEEYQDNPAEPDVVRSWLLNRISGELEIRTILPEPLIAKWRAKHGKSISSLWVWKQRCSAVKPKI